MRELFMKRKTRLFWAASFVTALKVAVPVLALPNAPVRVAQARKGGNVAVSTAPAAEFPVAARALIDPVLHRLSPMIASVLPAWF
jgi:hypothetical protein